MKRGQASMTKKNEISIRSGAAEYLTYAAVSGGIETSLEMRYEDENIWLTQKMLAELYDVDIRTVNYHINKIFADKELSRNSVIRKFWITATDGKNYDTNHYSLQMIIAVGFKVNSERAVQFRKWINEIASNYTTKAFNQQVARNKEKFEEDFMFTLTADEFENLISKNLTSSWGGRRKPPKVFTEQGIYNQSTSSCGLRQEQRRIQRRCQ
ncbi:MAG: ORF6N domain-containing protein [Synergistaceae bacterium]|nr:ORF6N domain-containing protein [Candidatus Equadaptatus faecalis]